MCLDAKIMMIKEYKRPWHSKIKKFVEVNVPINQKHRWVKFLNACGVLLVPLDSSGKNQDDRLNLDSKPGFIPSLAALKAGLHEPEAKGDGSRTKKISLKPLKSSRTTFLIWGTSLKILRGRRQRRTSKS